MVETSALVLGLGLGLRHATDADHVAAISAMVERCGARRAAWVATLWGLGHTASFLAVGFAIVLAGWRVPPSLERGADLLVAATLVALGLWHLLRKPGPALRTRAGSAARPVAVGLVHGLAGSGSIALLAVTMHSPFGASLYLLLFGLGTMLGMALLTLALSWPLSWTARQPGSLSRWVLRVPAMLSLTLGLVLGAQCLGLCA